LIGISAFATLTEFRDFRLAATPGTGGYRSPDPARCLGLTARFCAQDGNKAAPLASKRYEEEISENATPQTRKGCRAMKRARDCLNMVLTICGGAALVLMMLHISLEMLLRSAFSITIPGTIEFVSFYYMVCAVFFGLALVVLINEQVIVELFLNFLPPRALMIVDAIAALLGSAYAGVIAYGAWLEARSATRFGEMVPVYGFDMPTWPSRWIAFAALAFIVLASLGHAIAFLRGNKVEPS